MSTSTTDAALATPGAESVPLTETEPVAVTTAASRRSAIWRAAFRWHFYAGIFVIPVLFTLSVTGLIILVKPTLEHTFYGDRLQVQTLSTPPIPMALQQEAVELRYPGSTTFSIIPPANSGRSTQFDIATSDGEELSAYVNPYTGQFLGSIDNAHRLDNVAQKIHGTLWLDKWGDWLVEIVAGWTLVMVCTGLYLWWPRSRGAGRWRRAFVPRVRASGRRKWRDLHSSPGAIFGVVIIFLVLSGLPWSRFWGHQWGIITERNGHGYNSPETPVSDLQAIDLQTAGLRIPWANQQQAVPLATGGSSTQSEVPQPLAIEQVITVANTVGMNPGFAIGLPEDDTGVFTLSNGWPSRAQDERTVFVDQYSGKVLTQHGWDDYGALAKGTSWAIDAHMGRQLGVINAIVLAGACLTAIGSCLTAPVMWWKRRPRGQAGFPRRPIDPKIARGAGIIGLTLGVLFPLLGASMLLVLFVDLVIIRNIPTLRRTFGMRDAQPT